MQSFPVAKGKAEPFFHRPEVRLKRFGSIRATSWEFVKSWVLILYEPWPGA